MFILPGVPPHFIGSSNLCRGGKPKFHYNTLFSQGCFHLFSAKKPTFITEQSCFLLRADISTHALPRPPISTDDKFYIAHFKRFKTQIRPKLKVNKTKLGELVTSQKGILTEYPHSHIYFCPSAKFHFFN